MVNNIGYQNLLKKMLLIFVIDMLTMNSKTMFMKTIKNALVNLVFIKFGMGGTWKKVHMDVYTEENKNFHKLVRNSHPGKGNSPFSYEDIINIRKQLKDGKTELEIFDQYKDKIKYRQVFHEFCIYKTYPWILV